MTNECIRYEDLMERREVIFAAWMDRVREGQRPDGTLGFYGSGIILGPDGSLRISARDNDTGQGLWDLRIGPFSTEVEVVTV